MTLVPLKESMTVTIKTDYLTDAKGHRKGVVMSVREYKRLVDRLEDLEDALDIKKARQTAGEFIELDVLTDRLKKAGRIR